MPGNIILSIAFACSALHMIMPPLGPLRVLWVVVVTKSAKGTGEGCSPVCDQSGDVSNISHQECSRFFCDLGESLKIDYPRIGAGPTTMIFGLCSKASLRTSSMFMHPVSFITP